MKHGRILGNGIRFWVLLKIKLNSSWSSLECIVQWIDIKHNAYHHKIKSSEVWTKSPWAQTIKQISKLEAIIFLMQDSFLLGFRFWSHTYNMTNHNHNHFLKQFEFWCKAVFFSAFGILLFNSIWLNWWCTIMIRFGRNLSSGARVSSSPASASLASSPTSPPSSPSSPLRSASS